MLNALERLKVAWERDPVLKEESSRDISSGYGADIMYVLIYLS